jgi:tetratricopeptide (TPR) repeat protein
LERPEEGLTALEQALTLSPNKVNILAAKGEALFRLKRFEESLAAFEQALVLNPDDTELRESKLEVLQMLHSETDGQIM